MIKLSAANASPVLLTFCLLAGYFLLQVVLRVMLSDSLEIDEAEQLLLTQELHLVYGSTPPLYNWLQRVVFELLGTHIAALAITKNLVLFLAYGFTYLTIKEITRDERMALMGMLSLLLLPAIAWGSQRTLTHSVIATTVAAATLWVMVRLVRTRSPGYYGLFGLCAALGMLSKYNYALFLAPLLLAALSMERFRRYLLGKSLLLGLAVAVVVFMPHLHGLLSQPDTALGQLGELKVSQAPGYGDALTRGVSSVIVGFASHVVLLALVYSVLFFRAPRLRPRDAQTVSYRRLLQRTLIAAVLLACVAVLVLKMPTITTRWLQPLMVVVPVYAVLTLADRIDAGKFRRLATITAVVACLIPALLAARTLLRPLTGDYVTLNAPMAEFARQLRQRGFDGGVIVSNDRWLAGNLKLFFPDSVGLVPEFAHFAASGDKSWLVIWEPADSDGVPPSAAALVEAGRGEFPRDSVVGQLQAVYKYSPDGRRMTLFFVIMPPSSP